VKAEAKVDQIWIERTKEINLDSKLLPSGNAKGFFGYFLPREPTFGLALEKSNFCPWTNYMQFMQEQ